MKRSLLFVVMAIGFVAAYVGGATFAPFSDETTATGSVTAGTLVFSGDGTQEIVFDTESFCTNLAPGEDCEGEFTITNGGTLTGMIDAEVGEGGVFVVAEIGDITDPNTEDGECVAEDWDASAEVTDAAGDEVEFIPGDVHTITVTASLDYYIEGSDGESDETNRCQGASAEVIVTVTVEQAADPHDTEDDGLNGGE